jgi:phosphopantothenate synthetase
MTEEKIAGIRDVIKKKHSKIADYASDASTVKFDENEKLRIYKSDGVNYSSDVSTVKMEENEKLRILKSDGKNYSSDALSTKLDVFLLIFAII